MNTLDKLSLNEEVVIKAVKTNYALKRRLYELGFVPQEIVKCVLVSPFGDPKGYYVRGNIWALRETDASLIEVEHA